MLFQLYLIAQHAVIQHPLYIAETVYQYCNINVVKVSVHARVNQDRKLGAPIQACSCAELLIVYTSSFTPACSPLHALPQCTCISLVLGSFLWLSR